ERPQHDLAPAPGQADPMPGAVRVGILLLRSLLLHQLDADHHPALPDVADVLELGDLLEALLDPLRHLPAVLERVLLVEDAERGEGGGAGERIARVAVAVEEGPPALEGAEKALVDLVGDEGSGERQISAAEALREAE